MWNFYALFYSPVAVCPHFTAFTHWLACTFHWRRFLRPGNRDDTFFFSLSDSFRKEFERYVLSTWKFFSIPFLRLDLFFRMFYNVNDPPRGYTDVVYHGQWYFGLRVLLYTPWSGVFWLLYFLTPSFFSFSLSVFYLLWWPDPEIICINSIVETSYEQVWIRTGSLASFSRSRAETCTSAQVQCIADWWLQMHLLCIHIFFWLCSRTFVLFSCFVLLRWHVWFPI